MIILQPVFMWFFCIPYYFIYVFRSYYVLLFPFDFLLILNKSKRRSEGEWEERETQNGKHCVRFFCLREHVHNGKLFIIWLRNKNHPFKYQRKESTVSIIKAGTNGIIDDGSGGIDDDVETTTILCLASIKAFSRDHHLSYMYEYEYTLSLRSAVVNILYADALCVCVCALLTHSFFFYFHLHIKIEYKCWIFVHKDVDLSLLESKEPTIKSNVLNIKHFKSSRCAVNNIYLSIYYITVCVCHKVSFVWKHQQHSTISVIQSAVTIRFLMFSSRWCLIFSSIGTY